MVRLKDIAERAGVSVMTVSKVLRDAPDVSATTKARIKLLAQQMGYVPDSMAQALRNRTTRLFGLVIPSTSNPIFARTVAAIEERAHEIGYQLILCQTLSLPDREESVIRRLLSRRIEGLFLSPVYRRGENAAIYQELNDQKTPTIILGHKAPFCAQFLNVDTDDLLASSRATKYLLELGHRRIAFFGGPSASPAARERFEGYRLALREHSIEVEDRCLFSAGNRIEDGAKAAVELLNENPKVSAIQCANDLCAIGAADTLLKQGIRIPQDMSIVGFGNILAAEYFRVPLSTTTQPKYDLGIAAIDLMMKSLRGEKPDSKRLSSELIIRASTGPVSEVSQGG